MNNARYDHIMNRRERMNASSVRRPILQLLGIIALMSTTHMQYALMRSKSYFSARSQAEHAERELVTWYPGINRCEVGTDYGSVSMTFSYTQSFQGKNIARYFWGTDYLVISGSRVPERDRDELLADYFGLPTDYKSSVLVHPRVRNVMLDFDWFYGLDAFFKNVYVRIHAPLVHTSWQMCFDECVSWAGVNNHPAGYMASSLIERKKMACSAAQYLAGNVSFGDLQPLQYGKIAHHRTSLGVADIHVACGWNPICDETYHFGMNLRVIVPTGTTPKGEYMFESIIGNGHHWGLGVGFTGHGAHWYCNDEWMVGLYGDLNISHLFSSHQYRSFDFKANGPGSRYILMQEMGKPVNDGLTVDMMAADHQYHGKIMSAINKTRLGCEVSIALQLDMVIMMTWRTNNCNVDIGYNAWARTGETLECRDAFPEGCYALKGDAQLYGFLPNNQAVALNATQSNLQEATLHNNVRIEAGQGAGNASQTFTNANADNKANAEFNGTDLMQSYAPDGIKNTGLSATDIAQVKGSKPSVLIRNCDLDDTSAVSGSAMTHTVFLNIGYTWVDRIRVEPYLSLGGEIEFDGATRHSTNSLSQWAVWIKSGVSY